MEPTLRQGPCRLTCGWGGFRMCSSTRRIRSRHRRFRTPSPKLIRRGSTRSSSGCWRTRTRWLRPLLRGNTLRWTRTRRRWRRPFLMQRDESMRCRSNSNRTSAVFPSSPARGRRKAESKFPSNTRRVRALRSSACPSARRGKIRPGCRSIPSERAKDGWWSPKHGTRIGAPTPTVRRFRFSKPSADLWPCPSGGPMARSNSSSRLRAGMTLPFGFPAFRGPVCSACCSSCPCLSFPSGGRIGGPERISRRI